jgi:hypothetical protein
MRPGCSLLLVWTVLLVNHNESEDDESEGLCILRRHLLYVGNGRRDSQSS